MAAMEQPALDEAVSFDEDSFFDVLIEQVIQDNVDIFGEEAKSIYDDLEAYFENALPEGLSDQEKYKFGFDFESMALDMLASVSRYAYKAGFKHGVRMHRMIESF